MIGIERPESAFRRQPDISSERCYRPEMGLSVRIVGQSDSRLFDRTDEDLFDHPIDAKLLAEFLHDPRHHMAVADDDGLVVGFVSAVDYVHPDKPRQLWINEVGVAAPYRRQGVAKKLMRLMLDHARALGCTEAWVLTGVGNRAANALYRSISGGRPGDIPQQAMHVFALD